MRFKQFLEAKVSAYSSEDKDIDELAQLIKKHCDDARKNPVKIYRGTASTLKSGLYHPGTGERKSQNTSNYYTKLLDTNPRNKEFPLRSKSFIASTDSDRAGRYGADRRGGTTLTIFPYDDTEIGVANKEDFWDTEMKFTNGIDHNAWIVDMNIFWRELLEDESFVPSLDELMKFLRDSPIETIFKKLRDEHMVNINDNPMKAVKSFIDQLPEVYSYDHLGCTVETPHNLDAKRSEVWISGPCIAVNQHDIEKVKKILSL